ncbi:hypothetical protein CSP5_0689 [Cuniculiplasma divulgatum]|uniref:Uncharacterized protein n=1 Tax=Cuniculiplasma divulgatum TaxID=1673428 RepID=A0A1N5TVE2_9ARCH|nr:hypothetical protein CSP5_0689 [Cuniculiplasma divulgatum]SJK84545.1 hypothetical protein CPM_0686 [Cuniculiplasma divulgatum]
MGKNFQYRRLHVLSGDIRSGFYCTICNKEIKSISHYKYVHKEVYKKAIEQISIRN